MSQASSTKPCPNCGKPLRLDATNCWFCGDVFDTVRCAECGSPVKKGSKACQMCGEVAPDTFTTVPPPPPPATTSAAPPRATRASEQLCPACDGVVPLAAVQCRYCRAPLDGPNRRGRPHWGAGKSDLPHRGWQLLAMLACSPFCFPIVLAPLVVLMAVRDLHEMRAGRMDPSGLGLTVAALVVGGCVTLTAYILIAAALFNGWF